MLCKHTKFYLRKKKAAIQWLPLIKNIFNYYM